MNRMLDNELILLLLIKKLNKVLKTKLYEKKSYLVNLQ